MGNQTSKKSKSKKKDKKSSTKDTNSVEEKKDEPKIAVKAPLDSSKHKSQIPSTDSPKESTAIITDIVPNTQIGKALAAVPLFKHLSPTERDKLGGAMSVRNVREGAFIVKEADKAENFFVIKSGSCTVLRKDPDSGDQIELVSLEAGDHFGETALSLSKDFLPASVLADTDCELWVLHKTKFHILFKKGRIEVVFSTQGALFMTSREAVNAGGQHGEGSQADHEPYPNYGQGMSEQEHNFIQDAIKENPIWTSTLFKHFEDQFLKQVVFTMEPRDVKNGEDVVTQGEEGSEMFVVMSGQLDVWQHTGDEKQQKKIDSKKAGSSFGELAMMHNDVRSATVRATSDCTLRVLSRRWVTRYTREIVRKKEEIYGQWLKNVKLLAPLTSYDRARIAEALEVVRLEQHQIVFSQGDPGDGLYIIARGEVEFSAVDDDGKAKEMPIKTLGSGEYFGERSMYNSENARSATVTVCSKSGCKLLKLGRETVTAYMGPLDEILKNAAKSYDVKEEQSDWKPMGVPFEELKVVGVLGRGSYGFVQLVEARGKTMALKAISKQRIIDTHQKKHVCDERDLMKKLNHPFVVKLFDTYKDKNRLYFLMEPVLGGGMFPRLRRMRQMSREQAKFYSAQVLLVFEYLHSKDYVYRDLKPENLLFDKEGYLKMTDFGFLKHVKHKTYTMCGTPEYMAPEIISHWGHGKGVDWWCLGIFIFELLAGFTPFYRSGQDNLKMYERITVGKFHFPSHLDKNARPLIIGLLQTKPTQRLGCLQRGSNDIKAHRWFQGFDWQALLWRKLNPPLKVKVKHDKDLSAFKQTTREKNVKEYIDDGTGWDKDF